MQVTQLQTILNDFIIPEVLGTDDVKVENLTDVVTVGQDITSALTANGHMDNFVKKLIDRVGREINWNRPYISAAPNILRDSWEYGSALLKTRADLSDFTINDTWNLTAGVNYLDGTFTPPDVSAKIFNKRATMEIDCSFAEIQLKEAFTSATALGAFLGMIESRINDTMTVALDSMIMRTINTYMGAKIGASNAVINLLPVFNTRFGTELTAENAVTDKEFLRFAAYTILLYRSRIRQMSKQYNVGGVAAHTPAEYQKLVLLSDFAVGADVYLQSDTYHDELVQTGDYYTVPSWQANKGNTWANNSAIKVTHGQTETNVTGILGVLFDENACMVCCENRRVTSQYVPKGEFYNNYYKADCMYMIDPDENGVVFVAQDTE